jgi:hypothetical protein
LEGEVMMGLLKGIVEIAKLPVDVAADVVTLGGALTDKPRPYTAERCRRIMRKLDED